MCVFVCCTAICYNVSKAYKLQVWNAPLGNKQVLLISHPEHNVEDFPQQASV